MQGCTHRIRRRPVRSSRRGRSRWAGGGAPRLTAGKSSTCAAATATGEREPDARHHRAGGRAGARRRGGPTFPILAEDDEDSAPGELEFAAAVRCSSVPGDRLHPHAAHLPASTSFPDGSPSPAPSPTPSCGFVRDCLLRLRARRRPLARPTAPSLLSPRGSTTADRLRGGNGKTAGVPPLFAAGMLLSRAAYPPVLQMGVGQLLESV
jgi:hypothetical protein